jgi:hypothetical protein
MPRALAACAKGLIAAAGAVSGGMYNCLPSVSMLTRLPVGVVAG